MVKTQKQSELNTIIFDLDQLKHWIFQYKGKKYKLNVKELLKLLELIKNK